MAVGALPLPTKHVDVKINRIDGSCVAVERAYVESDTFRAYVTRTCRTAYNSSYWALHVNQKAPDGTIVDSFYTNLGHDLLIGDKLEFKPDIYQNWRLNPRTVLVEIYTVDRP